MNNIGSHPNDENLEYWTKGCSPGSGPLTKNCGADYHTKPLIEAAAQAPFGAAAVHRNGGMGPPSSLLKIFPRQEILVNPCIGFSRNR